MWWDPSTGKHLMDYVQWVSVHVAGWILILAASAGVGRLFLRKLSFDSRLERLVFTMAVGLGLCSLVLFGLGLFGLLYRSLILALTIVTVAGSGAHFIYSHRASRPRDYLWSNKTWQPRTWLMACAIIIAAGYWLMLFHRSLYPPVNWDSTAYHLVLVREYLDQHRIVVDYGVTLPVLPALNHMLFTWAMAIGDDILAQIIEHTLMMLTALALYAWGKRQKRPALGMAAAAFWLTQPLVLWLGESAYVDIGFACYAFLGVYALRVFWDERGAVWWYLGMTLMAMGAGVRLQGLVFMALAGGLGSWACLKTYLNWRALLAGGILAGVIVVPWYAFVGYQTGNPFWPALPGLSSGIWRFAAQAIWTTWTQVGVPKTAFNFVSLPVQFVLRPAPFLPDNGLPLFPVVIGFPIAWLVAFVNRSVRWWVFWAMAYTAFWFVGSQQMRFWVPALPLVGLALYESIQWIIDRISKSAVLQIVAWAALALFAVQAGARSTLQSIVRRGWPPPVNAEARERFLARSHVGYAAVVYIKKHAAEGDGVYVINGSWLNYDLGTRILDASAPLQELFRPAFRWPEDQWWVDWLDRENVKWILVIHNKAVSSRNTLIPERNPVTDPYWPDYQLVAADSTMWVFRRKPVPPDVSNNSAGLLEETARARNRYQCWSNLQSICLGVLPRSTLDPANATRIECGFPSLSCGGRS